MWGLHLFGPRSWGIWVWLWLYPCWLYQNTRAKCIFDEADTGPCLVSVGFIWMVNTIFVISKPQLVPSIKSGKLQSQARMPPLPISKVCNMSASKLIPWFFSVIQQYLGFFTMWLHNSESCQYKDCPESSWFSDWHWCSCSCHFRYKEAYFSCRAALADTTASLQGPDRGVTSVSEVHEPLIKLHDILDSAGSMGLVIQLIF